MGKGNSYRHAQERETICGNRRAAKHAIPAGRLRRVRSIVFDGILLPVDP
jgi:hypothetical protein